MTGPVVVLGATGMLGHKVFQQLNQSCETVAAIRGNWDALPEPARQLLPQARTRTIGDALDWEMLAQHIDDLRPSVVVNCLGIIKQRKDAASPVPGIAINALLPHRLAQRLAPWNGRLIHFSTDCVFSGRRGAYREEDESDAEDLYGRTKFLGEVIDGNAITLRTSMIGRELSGHRSLLDWFLSQRGRRILGFRRAIYSGITTNEMASVVGKLIGQHPKLSGLFHVVSQPISKHALLLLLHDAYQLDVTIEPSDLNVCDRSMIGERFTAATGWRAPSWPELIRELVRDATPYGPLTLTAP